MVQALALVLLGACASKQPGCYGQSQNGRRLGRWRCYEGNRALLKSDMNFDERGLKSGLALQYFADGSIDTESNWLGGLLHGPLKSHRASDQTLELESNYFNGQLHGPYRLYDAQGGIVESGLYEQGIIRFSEKLKAE